MPTFCRHGRFVERCPICSRAASGGLPGTPPARVAGTRTGARRRAGASASPTRDGLRVRRETRAQDDGFRHPLLPGVRSSHDALRLAEEMSFAAGRLSLLASDPPGLYAEAVEAPPEQGLWMALIVALVGPVEGDDSFGPLRALITDWASGELPDLSRAVPGPRSGLDSMRRAASLEGFRAWAQRAGGPAAALEGDPAWTPERRFERIFERLSAVGGLGRDVRYELLVSAGRLGLLDVRGATLALVGEEATVTAAKRVFGIGDRFNLERRASALAEAAAMPLEALDLALFNWGAPLRASMGVAPETRDAEVLERAQLALGV